MYVTVTIMIVIFFLNIRTYFLFVSDVTGVIWEEWWTYDGISGEFFFLRYVK